MSGPKGSSTRNTYGTTFPVFYPSIYDQTMMRSPLNLTRLWRSRTFEEIIGQPLIVRMLKNSLYRDLFFPVYLFAGSKGCGKTSTARVFAASINCAQLEHFQKNPEQHIPCLSCASCLAFSAAEHPDFIEIDGASHTSVDNVRSIIEASAFLPVLGRKKIYLIDEAHMLSKAAFNAFLKILEEPPRSVVFILATTDAHKIIDTVISRCFQLYFQPINPLVIADHLAFICKQEHITYEHEALALIASQSEGSARDGINALERIRFAYEKISVEHTRELLGCIENKKLIDFLAAILVGNAEALLITIADSSLEKYTSHVLWKSWIELLTEAIWAKIGREEKVLLYSFQDVSVVVTLSSLEQLNYYRKVCYHYELQFTKTAAPCELFQTILLMLCQAKVGGENKLVRPVSAKPKQEFLETIKKEVATPDAWQKFLAALTAYGDPLVESLFKQAKITTFDSKEQKITITLPQSTALFETRLQEMHTIWQPLLHKAYEQEVTLSMNFINEFTTKIPKETPGALSPRAQAIASLFPGAITIVKEHEL